MYCTQVPLGVIPKIITDLHQYVAQDFQVPFADLLTDVNSQSFQASLRGLKPFACDWHAKVNYI